MTAALNWRSRASATGHSVGQLIGRDVITILSLAWLVLVLIMAIWGDSLTPYDPNDVDLLGRLQPPFTHHGGHFYLLGTDRLGRDELSRLIVATRESVVIGFASAAVTTVAGLLLGSLAGYVGRGVDQVISRLVEVVQAFPILLLALLFLASVGPSSGAVIFILALGAWPVITRLARGLALEIRGKAYIDAVRVLDGSNAHAIRRHVIPNLLSPVFVYGTILAAQLMLASSGLDFLGLGLQPPDTSWGVMVAEGRTNIVEAWWLVTLPGLAIFLTALSFNLVAARIRDAGNRIPRPRPTETKTIAADLARAAAVLEPAGLEKALLAVHDLSVEFRTQSGTAQAVRHVSWSIDVGEVLAVVGESGSGKTATAKAIMGILEAQSAITSGEIRLRGNDLLAMPARKRRSMYGKSISMIHQDAIEALDPSMTIGDQVCEAVRVHDRAIRKDALLPRALDLLAKVGIQDPPQRARQYPFQLSGGMCQRVVIAMAIANNPDLLIADEPTTALDVTIQRQIVELLMALKAEFGMSLVLITHDLGLVSQCADRVVVMYGGQVMETGSVAQVIHASGHPYSKALMRVRPDINAGRRPLVPIPGAPPLATRLPLGCSFHPRCALAIDPCRESLPELTSLGDGQRSACHRAAFVHAS